MTACLGVINDLPSAWAILLSGFCQIVYSYAPNVSVQCWIGEDGVSIHLFRRCFNSWWFEQIQNCLPCRYWWNFFTENTMAKDSFPNCDYYFSASENVLYVKMMGFSLKTPIPYGEVSHERIRSLQGSKWTNSDDDCSHHRCSILFSLFECLL